MLPFSIYKILQISINDHALVLRGIYISLKGIIESLNDPFISFVIIGLLKYSLSKFFFINNYWGQYFTVRVVIY